MLNINNFVKKTNFVRNTFYESEIFDNDWRP